MLAAMGMKGRQIMGIFLLEGTLIGFIGAVIGGLIGVGLLAAVNVAGGVDLSFASGMGGDIMALMGNRLYPATTPASVIAPGAIDVVIAALASLYPAWQAARK